MSKQRIFALLLAVFMLTALLGGCAKTPNEPNDGNSSNNPATKPDDGKKPVEKSGEPDSMVWLGQETHYWASTFTDAVKNGNKNWEAITQALLDEQNLIVNPTVVEADAYQTTMSGYIASENLPDAFHSYDLLDMGTFFSMLERKMLADLDEVFAYSDGTVSGLFYNGGLCEPNRAAAMAPDGHWYHYGITDGQAAYFDLGDEYLCKFALGTFYPQNIRYDWLEKLNLAMPQNVEELYEALVAFQANDVNGNGVADERAMFYLGEGEMFYCGPGYMYGLPPMDFFQDQKTGEILPMAIQEGYIPYLQFCKRLYDAQVLYTGEGGAFTVAGDIAGDYCSMHVGYPTYYVAVETGDPNARYDPLPLFTAMDGVKVTLMGQGAVGWYFGVSHSSKSDYSVVCRFDDFMYSQTFYDLLTYGVRGVAWDLVDGEFVRYDLSDEQKAAGYGYAWSYLPQAGLPQIQCAFYSYTGNVYTSVQEALDNGEPYTGELKTFEEWKEWRGYDRISPVHAFYNNLNSYGLENINFQRNAAFLTMPSLEEFDYQQTFSNEYKAYFMEMTTNFVLGAISFEKYDEMVQYMYDNLQYQERINLAQTRANRYLKAIGRPEIPIG